MISGENPPGKLDFREVNLAGLQGVGAVMVDRKRP